MAFTYCENCGEKIDDSAKFCPNCGYSKTGAPNTGNGAETSGANSGGDNPYGAPGGYGNAQSPHGNQGGYGNAQNPYGAPGGYGQAPYGNRGGYGGENPYGSHNTPMFDNGQPRKVNVGVMVFSLIVLFCFNTICGIIAMVMAMNAPNEPTFEEMERKNKKAMIACIVGVIIGIVANIALFAVIIIAEMNGVSFY